MKKIGLIGDPHASDKPVREALAIFRREEVDEIWCTGDIAGYGNKLDETIRLLNDAGCQSILGNHEVWHLENGDGNHDSVTDNYINSMPLAMHKQVEGVRIYIVHASPPDSMEEGIRLLDQHGYVIESAKLEWKKRLSEFEHDILIVGHTHQVFAEKLGSVLVINPGSSRYNHCCAVLLLPQMIVQWFSLSDMVIQKSWNWGKEIQR